MLRRAFFFVCLVTFAFFGGMSTEVTAHPAGHHALPIQHTGEMSDDKAPTLHDFRAEGASHSLREMVLAASPDLSSTLDCQCRFCDDGFCAGPAAIEPSGDTIADIKRLSDVGLSDISPPRRTFSAIENPPKTFS
jgi:hypothetical protein